MTTIGSTSALSHDEVVVKPGTRCTPFEHHARSLAHRPVDDRPHAHVHHLDLLDETDERRVEVLAHRDAHGTGGIERRVVDGRHESRREEGPHDLADGVGGDQSDDAKSVGQLRGERALAHSGRPTDQDDNRLVLQRKPSPLRVALSVRRTLHLGERSPDPAGQVHRRSAPRDRRCAPAPARPSPPR